MKGDPKPTYRLVVADGLHSVGWEELHAATDIEVVGPLGCQEEFIGALADADGLLICSETKVDASLLAAAPRLKVVARAGARLDNVDIDQATRRGILVIHVPDANLTAMVEYVFLLMLALARNWGRQAGDEGQFGFQLKQKNLGIIGFGKQGRQVAERAQAFGMHVLAYDPYIDLSFARQRGVEIVDLPELLARADLVTLHTAYTQQTHQLINRETLAQMKPGGYLINCIYPGLMDAGAVLSALENGKLAGVALDNWDIRATPSYQALQDHPRTLRPHLGRSPGSTMDVQMASQHTLEAQSETARRVVSDLLAALRAQDFRHIVNLPFNDQIPYQRAKPFIDLAVKLGKLQGQLAEGWIQRVEVELLGEGLRELVRPVAAVLLSGMIRPVDERPVNWVSAPVMAYEQGIVTAQVKELVARSDHPAMIACRIYWQDGFRTVAGALYGNGEVRLVQYNDYEIDAYPDGWVLILENTDLPGVIGKVGTLLGRAGINIAQWRYGRDYSNGRGVSFINLDGDVPLSILSELENEAEIERARLVRL
ncbi:MAG: NAD(P)-dependent oxidoreductase [Anaerolineales bacterium]